MPSGNEIYPLILYMHGSTGQWEFYNNNYETYASHGFITLFPHIKGPKQDKNPLVTNTDGEYLIKAYNFAKIANEDESNPLYKKIDLENVIIAGHSMGASCTIKAAKRLPAGTAKLAIS